MSSKGELTESLRDGDHFLGLQYLPKRSRILREDDGVLSRFWFSPRKPADVASAILQVLRDNLFSGRALNRQVRVDVVEPAALPLVSLLKTGVDFVFDAGDFR